MATKTFDILKWVEKLKTAGFAPEQAEAVRAIADAQDELVTKAYLDAALEKAMAPVRTDQAVQKWMMGILLAGVISLVMKSFF